MNECAPSYSHSVTLSLYKTTFHQGKFCAYLTIQVTSAKFVRGDVSTKIAWTGRETLVVRHEWQPYFLQQFTGKALLCLTPTNSL